MEILFQSPLYTSHFLKYMKRIIKSPKTANSVVNATEFDQLFNLNERDGFYIFEREEQM